MRISQIVPKLPNFAQFSQPQEDALTQPWRIDTGVEKGARDGGGMPSRAIRVTGRDRTLVPVAGGRSTEAARDNAEGLLVRIVLLRLSLMIRPAKPAPRYSHRRVWCPEAHNPSVSIAVVFIFRTNEKFGPRTHNKTAAKRPRLLVGNGEP